MKFGMRDATTVYTLCSLYFLSVISVDMAAI
jgi:hypothetical protein